MNYLIKANANLKSMFPDKHIPITLNKIEPVYSRQLLSVNADAKTKKGVKLGYLTGILYLAPANISGVNLCPGASLGCRAACLFTAGRGAFYSVTRQRVIKTLAYHMDKPRFIASLSNSIRLVVNKANKLGMLPAIRLNGTSDIMWEHVAPQLFTEFSSIQFYDYTKIYGRMNSVLPFNYDLTFSQHETNAKLAGRVTKDGGRIAVVFNKIPKQAIDGDTHDLRFLDRKGVVIGLKAKGRARHDKTGFVIQMGDL